MASRFARLFGRRSGVWRPVLRRLRSFRRDRAALDPLATDDRPSAAFEASWRPLMKRRVLVVMAFLGLWVAGIQARLVQLQVFQHEWLAEKASTRHQRELETSAPRGDIRDRRGRILAYSVEAYGVYADPTLISDPQATAAAVCNALGDCSADERRAWPGKLAGRGQYVRLRWPGDISPMQADRVVALDLPGVRLQAGSHRYYPHAELGAHVLGFVGTDDGLAGLEHAFDNVVRGQPGLAIARIDAKSQRLETRVERDPVPGGQLELTIDLALQHIVERELKRGVLENHARAGTAVVMNPMTGEILATASYPTFDPNRPKSVPADHRGNRAVQNVYEPGSTFKIVTAAAALEQGIVRPADLIDTNPGSISLPGRRRPISEAGRHNYGVLSFEDVIVKSSNVGAVRVGLRTGANLMVDYVQRFGFGQRHLRDLTGGTPGLWNPAGLNDSGLASVSMGYQISVTPLQMAVAASVVANGGLLMRPYLVRAIVRNGEREVRQPETLRRAIQPQTAATLTAIMEAVTERGTAKTAKLDRYQVAGKTGTAQQAVEGGYSETDYHASFVGFVPSRRPVFTILVVIDRPLAQGHYGGGVAGPIFKRIAEASLRQWGVPPTIDPLPPVILSDGREPARHRSPTPSIIPVSVPLGRHTLVPDVRGLSGREALRTLSGAGLTVSVSGSGVVVEQTPAPGEPVAADAWGAIRLERRADAEPLRGAHR